MEIDHYQYTANDSFQIFEFESFGPNGKIKKGIRFTLRNANGVTYFNLAFGDIDEKTGKLNDRTVSNNKDTEKILATIGSAVLELTELYPDIMVYAKGSTPARTRLYQMAIAANWQKIKPMLIIFGFSNGEWYKFEKNTNYEAFLAFREMP